MSVATVETRRPGVNVTQHLGLYGVYYALLILVIFNAIITPHFVTLTNLQTQLYQVATVALVALGMALVIGTAGVDLSVGSVMALAAATLPLTLGLGFPAALVITLVAGVLSGLWNGFLVGVLRVQPIIATLALFVGGRGLAIVLAGGQSTPVSDPALLGLARDRLLGFPEGAWLAVGLAVLISLMIQRTTFGRQILAVGANPEAAKLAGVPVRRVLIAVYVICAVLAALSGDLRTAQLEFSAPADVGVLIELSAITAVVVGGTPLNGGAVRVLGTLAGVLLMQLISTTLIAHNFTDATTRIVQGAVIVGAVWIQRRQQGT